MLDLVLRGGKILDGTGGPMRDGDVCIRGERIASIGHSHGGYTTLFAMAFDERRGTAG